MSSNQMMYDELPNTCRAMSYAHPDRLATIGRLFGMNPPAVTECRVLELGCCDGSHLISIAHSVPGSHCVGIDLSEKAIAKGQAAIDALELNNITLKQLDISQLDDSIGEFDYIIAHGIYSWVTPTLQDKILSVCKQQLAPNGIAYVSYDTYPGWKMRETIQDIMHYHRSQLPESSDSLQPLRGLLQFFHGASQARDTFYNHFLVEELSQLIQSPDNFLLHKFLSGENKPIYFHQFIEQARKYELDYLGDAFIHTMVTEELPTSVAHALEGMKHNLIHLEQTMDFLRNRHFRHTLLCHQGFALKRWLSPELIEDFYVASSLQPVEKNEQSIPQFANQKGNVSTEQPIVQTMLNCLWERWPNHLAFRDLIGQVGEKMGIELDQTEQHTLANVLLSSYLKELIEFHSYPFQYTTQVSQYPNASELARWQVQQGIRQVTNLKGESVELDNTFSLFLLPLLDGQHDFLQLLNALEQWIKQGDLKLDIRHPDGTEPSVSLNEQQTRSVLSGVLQGMLQVLGNQALLVS